MSTEVGSAYVTLIPSLRGFSTKAQAELSRSGLGSRFGQQLTSEATRAGTRAGGLFSRSFARANARGVNFPGPSAALIRNVRTYGYAVAGVGTVTAGLGLATATAMEQAQIAFTTMLGSAAKAKTFLAGLTKFAKTTPFDLPGVVTASQKLLAFGFSAKETLPTLTALGDAAAGLSLGTEGLDRLTTAVGQIQAKGKVQSDELLQLTESGVPALKILANQFGVTTAKMQKYVTAGLVPAEKAIPALLQGLEKGTDGLAGKTAKFGGLMEKQSHTLGGVLSNLKDTVSQGLGRAVLPLAHTLERVLPKAMRRLPGLFDSIQGGVRRAIPAVENFAGKAKKLFEQLKPTLHDLWVNTVNFAKALRPILPHLAKITGGVIVGGLKALSGAMRFLAQHATTLRIAVDLLIARMLVLTGARMIARIGALGAAFNPVTAVIAGLAIGADAAYSTVRNENAKAAASFAALARKGAKALHDLEFKWLELSQVAKQQGGIQGAATQALADAMKSGLEQAGVSLDNFVAKVRNVANEVVNGIAPVVSFFRTLGGGVATPNVNLKRDPGHPGAYIVPEVADAGSKKSQKVAADVGFKLGKSLHDGVDKGLKKTAATVVDRILGPLRDLRNKARDLAKSIADGITGNLGLGSLVSSTDSLGTQFATSLSGIISGLVGQRSTVRKFRHQIQQLENRGLSEAGIQQIVAMGAVEGSGFAATLLSGTRKQIHRISRLVGGINRGAAGIGLDVAQDVYGPRIAAEIQRTTRAVEKASKNTELGDKTVNRLEHAFERAQKRSKVYLDTGHLDRHYGRQAVAG